MSQNEFILQKMRIFPRFSTIRETLSINIIRNIIVADVTFVQKLHLVIVHLYHV